MLARDAYLYVPEVKIGLNLQWGALPRLITLRSKLINFRHAKPLRNKPNTRNSNRSA